MPSNAPIIGNINRILWQLAVLVLIFAACRKQPSQPEAATSSLSITAKETSVISGSQLQLYAVAHLSNSSIDTVTTSANWSLAPGVAGQILSDGRFLAFANQTGTELVQADYRGLHATIQIAVVKRALNFVISPVIANLAETGKLQLAATAQFDDGSQALVNQQTQWSVLPGLAAAIDSTGLLRALPDRTGTEKVYAKYQSFLAQSEIRIQDSYTSPFEMVTIPAGPFIMGDDNGPSNERPAHEVQIDAFQMGKYEITSAQYATFLNQALVRGDIYYESSIIPAKRGTFAGMAYLKICPTGDLPEKLIEYVEVENNVFEFRAQPGFEQYPIVRLTWYGAAAFCEFYGLRLPTEAEWEKACRSGQQLAYGTADGTLSHELANFAGTAGRDVFTTLAPVGSFPPNPFGLYDMAGNAAEFVFDIYQRDYYANSPAANPHGPGPVYPLGRLTINGQPAVAVNRGGSWVDESFCRASRRYTFTSDLPDQCEISQALGGFRVARSLP